MNARILDLTMTSLTEIDRRIAQSPSGRLTLDPRRASATPLAELVPKLADGFQSAHLAAAASAVAEAQIDNFPDNLFWDFDFCLASIHRHACDASDYARCLRDVASLTIRLMKMHGQQSAIRFRYVHDFMYGFDWARWVRRNPADRNGVGPFEIEFLKQAESRGHDLLSLIEADDEWYPQLEKGASRNPFPFSREPREELRLYRALADHGYVPVEAWRVDAEPEAERDFDVLRQETARALGLGG